MLKANLRDCSVSSNEQKQDKYDEKILQRSNVPVYCSHNAGSRRNRRKSQYPYEATDDTKADLVLGPLRRT